MRVGMLTVILLLAGLTVCAQSPASYRVQQLERSDYGALAVALRQELFELGGLMPVPVCLEVLPKRTASRPLLDYLQDKGIKVSNESACVAHGHHSLRKVEIKVSDLKRGGSGELDFVVQSADVTDGPHVHFSKPLRTGTYRVKRSGKDNWEVGSYKKSEGSK